MTSCKHHVIVERSRHFTRTQTDIDFFQIAQLLKVNCNKLRGLRKNEAITFASACDLFICSVKKIPKKMEEETQRDWEEKTKIEA